MLKIHRNELAALIDFIFQVPDTSDNLFSKKSRNIRAIADNTYEYDLFISYVEPYETWVWDILIPRLEKAELRISVSGDVEIQGVARIVIWNEVSDRQNVP